jgi:hypothetical protein
MNNKDCCTVSFISDEVPQVTLVVVSYGHIFADPCLSNTLHYTTVAKENGKTFYIRSNLQNFPAKFTPAKFTIAI